MAWKMPLILILVENYRWRTLWELGYPVLRGMLETLYHFFLVLSTVVLPGTYHGSSVSFETWGSDHMVFAWFLFLSQSMLKDFQNRIFPILFQRVADTLLYWSCSMVLYFDTVLSTWPFYSGQILVEQFVFDIVVRSNWSKTGRDPWHILVFSPSIVEPVLLKKFYDQYKCSSETKTLCT